MKRTNLTVITISGLLALPMIGMGQAGVGSDMWSKTGNDIRNTNEGNVGINTGNPVSRLHVRGRTTLQGDLKMKGDDHTIIFPSSTAPNEPMIYMFDSGIVNADRMVLSHSPAYADWGLQYSDLLDQFRFLQGGVPILEIDSGIDAQGTFTAHSAASFLATLTAHQPVHVHQGIQLTGGLSYYALHMQSPLDSIVFPATNSTNEPMIHMFDAGTLNQNRMVLSHSPNYDDWGLEYVDAGDEFHFRNSARTVLNVDLGSSRVAVASTSTSGGAAFQVGDAGDGSFAIANSWSLFSSRDYKKDIEQLDGADCQDVLDEVVATPVFKFRYNEESEDIEQRLGLIVEESPDRLLSPETKGVDLGRYVTALHAAVKAQQELIETQSAQMLALQQELSKLRDER